MHSVKAEGGHVKLSKSLPNCLLCYSNNNVFCRGANMVHCLFCTQFCCMWTWEMMWLREKSSNFVVVEDNNMPFGIFTGL